MTSSRPNFFAALPLLLLLLVSARVAAEPVETIVQNGSSRNRLDIAILGDGYTAGELQKYKNDAQTFIQGFFAQEPFKEYQTYFNVHRIDVISNQSGADHPERTPQFLVDTALDGTYNCGGIQRLICVNTGKVNNIVSNTLDPSRHDIVMVIVNDSAYGGSGGSTAVVSTNLQAVEIILHEEGHSLGLLGDEYGGPPPPTCNNSVEPFSANVTRETQRSAIKWNAWIDANTPLPTNSSAPGIPGLYQGAGYCDTGLFRPTYSSKMRVLGFPFEQINTEQLIRRIHVFVSPLDSSSPANSSLTLIKGQTQTFNVTTPTPLTHSLVVTWLVDDQPQSSGLNFILDSQNLSTGIHTVKASVSDPTPSVRSDPARLLTAIATWGVKVDSAASAPALQFSAANYDASEGAGSVNITVYRSGDTSASATVEFASSDGSANQATDYEVASGTLSFAAGESSKTFNVLLVDDAFIEGSETLTLTLSNASGASLGSPGSATVTILDNDTATFTSPRAKQFVANFEGAQVQPPTTNTIKGNGGVIQLSADETSAKVSLIFSGLTGNETAADIHGPAGPGAAAPVVFTLPLGTPTTDFQINPTALQLASLRAGELYMDVHSAGFPEGEVRGQLRWNPLEEAQFFVNQAYFDFLSRNPDRSGFAFWTDIIAQCASDVRCLRDKRIDVSNAFFFEQEYQQTGAYVYRLYRIAYGNNQPFANPNSDPFFPNEEKKQPSYAVFVADRARVVGGTDLAQSQQEFANALLQRPQFSSKYSPGLNLSEFVDALLNSIRTDLGVDLASQKSALIALGARSAVLYRLADDSPTNPINNRPLIDAEYNRAFVITQYFGYLRRDADIAGFVFWLGQVNSAALRDVPRQHAMVCSFTTSAEYQLRFGAVAPRTNAECPQ